MSDFGTVYRPAVMPPESDALILELYPTAESLAGGSGVDFGVKWRPPVIPIDMIPPEFVDYSLPVYQSEDPANYTTTSISVEENTVNTNPLTDPKNKPLLIGAGVLLAVGGVYFLSKNSKKPSTKGGSSK